MKILSFTELWPKLKQDDFTTIRPWGLYWQLGEDVQVWYKNRSPKRRKLGTAKIIDIEQVTLLPEYVGTNRRIISEDEAINDGFPGGLKEMVTWMHNTYRCNFNPVMQVMTLRWITREAKEVKP